MPVTIKDKGYNRIKRELMNSQRAIVQVGIHQDAGQNDGTAIAEYAAYNEFGTKHIPSRPFMRQSFDNALPRLSKYISRKYGDVLVGRSTTRQALEMIGLYFQKEIQTTISKVDFLPRLKSTTVKQKKGSSKTLIDTGTMRRAIMFKVKM